MTVVLHGAWLQGVLGQAVYARTAGRAYSGEGQIEDVTTTAHSTSRGCRDGCSGGVKGLLLSGGVALELG